MIDRDLWQRLRRELQNLFPLFRYLILQTETHAFCLALAAAALIGFFPACLVILAIFKDILKWNEGYDVFVKLVFPSYFPVSAEWVTRQLQARFILMGHRSGLGSLLWVLLGAAGVFVPLETALNRLWRAHADRPYWMNQIVGFTLTIGCTLLALLFLSIATTLHTRVHYLPLEFVRTATHFTITRATMTCFFMVTVFCLYKFLPNKKVAAAQVLPAAIVAGVMVEIVRMIFVRVIPNLEPTQGPFAISVTFLLLVYFETFVVLGCAFLASQTDRYPWMGFLPRRANRSSSS